jgi:mannose-6-phosphate isomerase-like protein (cupin superfamily)
MRKLNRREMGGALAAMAAVFAAGAEAQGSAALLESKVFPYEGMPVRKMANGGESRNVLQGMLPTGEAVGVHESMQPAGMVPNPAHTIEHSEIMMVLEGTLEFHHDGKVDRVGPGEVIYIAYGTEHQVRNVGNGPVRYAIVAVGGDIKKV